jgi:hypothetical protein
MLFLASFTPSLFALGDEVIHASRLPAPEAHKLLNLPKLPPS